MKPTASPIRWFRHLRWLDVASVCALVAAGVLLILSLPLTNFFRTIDNAEERVGGQVAGAIDNIDLLPPSADLPYADERTQTDSLRAIIVSNNVFSSSRRAPTTAFAPPGAAWTTREAEPAIMAGSPDPMSDMAGEPAESVSYPLLSGIVVQQGVRLALLQLRNSDAVPRLYREGDVDASYRIVRVGADHVVVSSRSGSRTLRLAVPRPSDRTPSLPHLP